MKKSIVTKSLLFVILSQSVAQADLLDLPNPMEGETNTPVRQEPVVQNPVPVQTQYADSLGINGISRKSGGTVYRIDLAQALRLQRLDLRVAVSRVKVHKASLVTESGNRVPVIMRNAAVLETSSLTSSENFSLNERISSIEIVMESYSAEADVILTALAETEVPKLSLRATAPIQTPKPIQNPDVIVTRPDVYRPPVATRSTYRVGDQVLYQSQAVGTLIQVYGQGQVEISLNDYNFRGVVPESKITKSVPCVGSICQGDGVSYANQYAEVLYVFANGLAQISMDNRGRQSVLVVKASILRKYQAPDRVRLVECLDNFCVGDEVIYGRNRTIINEITEDGMAWISVSGNRQMEVRLWDLRPTRRYIN